MIRCNHPRIGGVVLSIAMMASPAQADRMGGDSPFPSRYADYYEISASDGMLIGAEGRTGDSMRYEGTKVWRGPGSATVLVRERNNQGLVMGTIRAKGHTYTVLMDTFGGDRPYQSGGIARFVELHGLTKRGAPILPKTFAYLAGWGSPCTVWKDGQVLHDHFKCHFMLTEEIRDPETGAVPDFPSKEEVSQVVGSGAAEWSRRDRRVRRQIRESADSDHHGLQLHLIAHSPQADKHHLPPFEIAMHFMWNEVQWWSGSSGPIQGRAGGSSDQDLTRAITRRLASNELLDPRQIYVSVKDGDVTLKGRTDSAIEKDHAYFSAWVPGVKAVRNHIDVQRPEPPGDQELRQAIQQAYRLDPRMVHSRPDVHVEQGVVTLRGPVASARAKRAAKDVAREFEGVEDVINKLKIEGKRSKGESSDLEASARYDVEPLEYPISKPDRELQKDIESELSWSPFVDAEQITVSVKGGVAKLYGVVEDHDEMQAAIDNAYEAGAGRVVNRLALREEEEGLGPLRDDRGLMETDRYKTPYGDRYGWGS